MKRLILIGVFLLGICSISYAEPLKLGEVLEKFPLKQGVAWSLEDSKLNYLSTIEVANWKGICLEAGYAGEAENTRHKAVAVISYPIVKLSDFGVTLPILNLVELNLGIYGGYGQINLGEGMGEGNNEWDYGLSVSLISIKW